MVHRIRQVSLRVYQSRRGSKSLIEFGKVLLCLGVSAGVIEYVRFR
jgi:hypothetical protein